MRNKTAEWPAVNAASTDATLFAAAPASAGSSGVAPASRRCEFRGSQPTAQSSQLPYESQRDSSAEHRRLSRQCLAILDRLQQGPATNVELAKIARKYTGRISDLRKAGYKIECYDRDAVTGICWYRLGHSPD